MSVEGPLGVVSLSGKPAMVLAMVISAPRLSIPVERVLAEVWADQPASKAAASLDTILWRLRKTLAPTGTPDTNSLIRSVHGSLRLDLDEMSIDSRLVERFADESAALLEDGDIELAIDRSDQAIELVRGEFAEASPSTDTIDHRRDQLHEVVSGLNEVRWSALLRRGGAQTVVQEVAAAIHAHPLRERNWEFRMEAALALGRPTDALRDYRHIRQLLRDELGIEPGARLSQLQRDALAGAEASARVRRAATRPDRPPRVDEFFVGRGEDKERVLIALESSRLVTVVGAGGIGKSRLAIAAAGDFGSRNSTLVRFIGLAGIVQADSPEVIAHSVAGMMGLASASASPLDSIVEILDRQPTLLVLDNCEHLAPSIREFLDQIISVTDSVTVLATSRRPTGTRGELVLEIAPLTDTAGEALLLHRSLAVGGRTPTSEDEAAVASILHAVENLPLGIELVAAQTRAFRLPDLARALELSVEDVTGVPGHNGERHGSITAAIDWSYRLLDRDERAMFRRLGVFRSQFTVEDAFSVLPQDSAGAIRDLIRSLVDHSLLVSDTDVGTDNASWFRMLEPIRQYAHRRLIEHGELESAQHQLVRWAHSRIGSRPRFSAEDVEGWNDAMERSWGTVRTILAELLTDDSCSADVAVRVSMFAAMRQRTNDAVGAIVASVRQSDDSRTALLKRASIIGLEMYRRTEEEANRSDDASRIATELIELAWDGPLDPTINDAVLALAATSRYANAYRNVIDVIEPAMPLFERFQDRMALLTGECLLQVAHLATETPDRAAESLHRLLSMREECRAAGSFIGQFYCDRGALMAATRHLDGRIISADTFREFLAFAEEMVAWGSRDFVDAIEILATILSQLGDFASSAQAAGAADAERVRTGSPQAVATQWRDHNVARALENLSEKEFRRHYESGLAEGIRIMDRVTPTGLVAADTLD